MVVGTKNFQMTGITLVRSQNQSNTDQFLLEIGCIVELITVDNGKKRRNGMSNKEVSD